MGRSTPLFWLGLATTVAFWSGMLNAGTAPRWVVLAIGVPLCLILMGMRTGTRSWWPVLILASAGVTLAWSPDVLGGIDSLIQLSILMGAFWLGANVYSLDAAWRGIQVGIAALSILVIAQCFGYQEIPQAVAPAGLFINKNMMGEAAMVSAVSALAMASWWALVPALVILIATTSKAAVGAFLLALGLWLRRHHPRLGTALLVLVGLAAIAGFAVGLSSATERLLIWNLAFEGLTPLGSGLGGFNWKYPTIEYIHSEPLQLIYELGVFSIPFFAVLIYALGAPNADREKFILVAVGAVSFFSFPLHMPLTGFAAALAAGHLAGARNRLRVRSLSAGIPLGVRA